MPFAFPKCYFYYFYFWGVYCFTGFNHEGALQRYLIWSLQPIYLSAKNQDCS